MGVFFFWGGGGGGVVGGGGGGGFLLAYLSSQQYASYLRDLPAQTTVRAASLRWKLQIKLATPPSTNTDTSPTSPSTDPDTPGAWQGSHWCIIFQITGMTGRGKPPREMGVLTPVQPVPALTLTRQAPGRVATGVSFFKSLYDWTWKPPPPPHGEMGSRH